VRKIDRADFIKRDKGPVFGNGIHEIDYWVLLTTARVEGDMMKAAVKRLSAGMIIVALAITVNAYGEAIDAFRGEKGTVKIAGGTAHIPVLKEAARLIMTANPDIKITIAGGGSGVGIKQLGEGLVDIGNTGRKPTDAEIVKYDLKMFQWAIDGVGVVVNPRNQVRSLTRAVLQDIFTGTITNWKALGGVDRGINVYIRDEASGTREVFWQKALDQKEGTTKANVVVSNGAMKSAVANDPYAIGYISVGHIDPTVAPVSIDDVSPTLANVKTGKYAIARGLFSNTRKEPKGLTKKFIEYLFTPEGQAIVAKDGLIPVK
jgi:phosphate transport system substrate-binding protein